MTESEIEQIAEQFADLGGDYDMMVNHLHGQEISGQRIYHGEAQDIVQRIIRMRNKKKSP